MHEVVMELLEPKLKELENGKRNLIFNFTSSNRKEIFYVDCR